MRIIICILSLLIAISCGSKMEQKKEEYLHSDSNQIEKQNVEMASAKNDTIETKTVDSVNRIYPDYFIISDEKLSEYKSINAAKASGKWRLS